jgi:replicative DNA helicase
MNTAAEPLASNLEAEKSVLGSLLVQGERILDVADTLQAKHFYRDAHGTIYTAMLDLTTAGEPVEPVTVKDQLARRRQLEAVGGALYIHQLMDGMPRGFHLAAHVRIIVERATKARLAEVARQTLNDIDEHAEDDARSLLDRAERRMFAVAENDRRTDFVDAQQLAGEGIPAVEKLLETKTGVTGLATGWPDLDDMTRGLQPGSFALIAARPSMGKTSLALGIAWHAASHGHTVGFFSLETSRQDIFMRLTAMIGGLDGHRLQSGYVSQTDYSRMADAFGQIANSSLNVDDSAQLGAYDLRGKARRLKARKGLGLVVVDYLQLMSTSGRPENRNLAISDISRALKLVARELNIPVVALSQLSRETERRGGEKKPMLSDLRDSGALEQDADVVMFIHRPEVYQPTDQNAGLAEVIIAKHRNGPTGTIRLRWSKESTRFDSWSSR